MTQQDQAHVLPPFAAPASQQDASEGETLDQKAENALLWCYRRLKNSYGRLPFVEDAVAGLRERTAAAGAARQGGNTSEENGGASVPPLTAPAPLTDPDTSLPELAQIFFLAMQSGRPVTLSAESCGVLFDAMTKAAPAAPVQTAEQLVPKWAGEFTSFQDWVNRAQRVLSVPSHKPNAICVDAKGRRCFIGADMSRARDEGAFPVRYFWECELVAAPVQAEQAQVEPTPLDYRAQGREEALAIILAQSAEAPFSECIGYCRSGAPDDEGGCYWDEEKLRALLHIGDKTHDAYDRAEAAYWDALGTKEEAEREMRMVESAPFYKPLNDFLSKHEAWDLMADLKRAAPALPAQAEQAQAAMLEQIAQSWDGCMVDAPGETMDVGATLRHQFKQLPANAEQAAAVRAADLDAIKAAIDVLDAFGNLPDGMMHPGPWNDRKAEAKIKAAREALTNLGALAKESAIQAPSQQGESK